MWWRSLTSQSWHQQVEMWRQTVCRCTVSTQWDDLMLLPEPGLEAPLVICPAGLQSCPVCRHKAPPQALVWLYSPSETHITWSDEISVTRSRLNCSCCDRPLYWLKPDSPQSEKTPPGEAFVGNIRWHHKNERLIFNSVKWVVQLLWRLQRSALLLTFATQQFCEAKFIF